MDFDLKLVMINYINPKTGGMMKKARYLLEDSRNGSRKYYSYQEVKSFLRDNFKIAGLKLSKSGAIIRDWKTVDRSIKLFR